MNANGPATVGDPDMSPVVAFSVSPVGSVPALIVNAYGAVPPVALIVWLYALPTVPFGSVGGAIASVAATANHGRSCS